MEARFFRASPTPQREVRNVENETDEVVAAVLEHCLRGSRLAGLRGRHPMSTVYRRVGTLVSRGLLAKEGAVYRTTDRGRQALRAPPSRSPLDRTIPQLAYAPTSVHRAILELVTAAVVIRQHGSRDDHHPAFVLLGPTLTWKTWTAKMMCAMLGLDSVDHVLLAHAETGRSLLTRRGYAGSTVSKRGILSSPFFALDEFHKADNRAGRMAGVYVQGTRVIAYENERLEIRPVPMLILNPFKGDSLEARTNLDDAQIRRCVVADLEGARIPEALRSRGEEFLAEARKAKPVSLADRRPADCSALRDALTGTLRRSLMPDAVQRVDEELVLQLAEGMAAFLPPEEAWIVVVRDLLTVWETLGWTAPGWRLRLPAAPASRAVTPARDAAGPRALSLQEETRRVIAEATGPIPRDLGTAKLIASAKAELKAVRETVRNERETLNRLHKEAQTTPRLIAEFVAARNHLKSVGLSWDAPGLHRAAQVYAREGANAGRVIKLAHDLVDHGIKDGVADLVVQSLPAGMAWEQVAAWLGSVARQYGTLQGAIAAEQGKEREARDRAARASLLADRYRDEADEALRARDAALKDLADVEADREKRARQAQELGVANEDLQKAIAEASAERDRIQGENERLRATLEKTNSRLTALGTTLARQHHLAALYAALRGGLLGNPKAARAILEGLGTRAGEDSVRQLRALVREALGDSVVPREDIEAERRQWNEQEAGLRKKLADAGRALAEERASKERAEAKVRTLETAAAVATEEKKRSDAELARYREKSEAAERVLPLAPDGRPMPLGELDARVQRVYREAIDRSARTQADRTIARAVASKGLVVVRSVTLSKRCARGHAFQRTLSPREIERLRTGEMSSRIVPFLQTPGEGYVACPTCGARVTATLDEVLKQLAARPAS